MPKKEWPPLGEQPKVTYVYEGETPVIIPYQGGEYLVKPNVEFEFPMQIAEKLKDRKGFKEIGQPKEKCEVCGGTNIHYKEGCLDCKEKLKKSSKKKKAELEDKKSEEEIKEE